MSISIPPSGELNKRVEFFRRTDMPADNFGATQVDETIGFYWVKIEPVGAMTFYGQVQQNQIVSHRIWVRAYPNKTDIYSITHGVMIRYQGRVYQPIRVMDANGKNLFTVIECTELGIDNKEQGNLLSELVNGS